MSEVTLTREQAEAWIARAEQACARVADEQARELEGGAR